MIIRDVHKAPRAVQLEFYEPETGDRFLLIINSGPMWFRWDRESRCYREIQQKEKTAKLWRKLKKVSY